MMSKHDPRRPAGDDGPLPRERLLRAIVDIDRQLAEYRRTSSAVPLDLHRAKRILKAALRRCDQPFHPPFAS